ncbi:penicillin-binding protein activator LpoB [Nibricoccus sp. IMCC34717]|uniref:penicillin-binding protein activator LpoB n=1 Tax=Nibricoccus sp. IMCC34717 TaxID=3034021 RepID=UPI00384CD992
MKLKSSLPLALVALALAFSGCESQQEVKAVDPKANQIINADQISPQEWAQAADKLINNLISSGVLDRAPQLPAIMGVSRIVNNTQQQVDTDALVKKLRVALNQTGKVITTTTVGLGGKAEDPLAKEAAEYAAAMGGEKPVTQMPYWSLSGKLLEDRVKSGASTQITYTFQLTLTQVKTGLGQWEAEEQISKVAKRPGVGW